MPRKKVNASKVANKLDYNNLQVDDVLCPICRTILLEPVTLPCNHTFCYVCFNDTMENANLVCPLCRLRVGSWLRGAKKDKKLINELLWTAIKKQYHKEVQNKYSGIENDFEEDKPIRVVANPGEIRKEYEIQKQKDEDEFQKLKEAEEKASKELIRRIQQEEEYKLAVEEEKMKLDAELAKKLASELLPSTSKMVNSKKGKKFGPLDKFITNNSNNKSNKVNVPNQNPNNFATKEYTCRVICLDKETKSNAHKNNLYKNSVVPVFQKKIQQIQKILESEEASSRSRDSKSGSSSDIIESEYKFYFKPINFQNNPPTQQSSPIKIPCKKAAVNGSNPKVVSPSGMIQFQSNMLESAFARISLQFSQSEKTESSKVHPKFESKSRLKRKYQEQRLKSPPKKTAKSSLTKEIFLQKNQNSKSDSPPFYGYDLNTNKKGGDVIKQEVIDDDAQTQKLLQEQADYEFAKRLQEEFNRTSVNTRSRRSVRRQVTLDEMLLV